MESRPIDPLTTRMVGPVLQGLALGLGMVLGWLWAASVLGQALVFRYQGF